MATVTHNVTESIGMSDILSGSSVAFDQGDVIRVTDTATVAKSASGVVPNVNQPTAIWLVNPFNYVELWEETD